MSGFYAWVSVSFPYARAIGIRQVAGFVGLGVMMGVSMAGKYVFAAFQALGLIPRGADDELIALREFRASDVTAVEGPDAGR